MVKPYTFPGGYRFHSLLPPGLCRLAAYAHRTTVLALPRAYRTRRLHHYALHHGCSLVFYYRPIVCPTEIQRHPPEFARHGHIISLLGYVAHPRYCAPYLEASRGNPAPIPVALRRGYPFAYLR